MESLTAYFPSLERESIRVRPGLHAAGAASAAVRDVEGFEHVWVYARPTVAPALAMYAAGYVEGLLTAARIEALTANTMADQFGDKPAHGVMAWLKANFAYVRSHPQSDRFGQRLALMVAQFDGLLAGARAGGAQIDEVHLLLLNANGDLEDLTRVVGQMSVRKDKCSALVKLRPNGDLFFGHATWDSYAMMVRSLKFYDLDLLGLERFSMSFSSSPGLLSSVDDFYITSRGLAVMETTNGQYTPELDLLVTSESVLSWMRSAIATTLAHNATDWATLFSYENSGTYNNQWMALEFNRSQPVLIVLEQSPGFVEVHDKSDHLMREGYWASFNVPAFSTTYNRTGFQHRKPHSNFDLATCARGRMFAAKQSGVRSLEDLQRVLRYNDFSRDPMSNGNACVAIAERCDLNTGGKWKLNGAVDAKVTTRELAANLTFYAQFGPTHDQHPPFRWTDVAGGPLRHGQPDVFDFNWAAFGPLHAAAVQEEATLATADRSVAMAFASSLAVCVAFVLVPRWARRKEPSLTAEPLLG